MAPQLVLLGLALSFMGATVASESVFKDPLDYPSQQRTRLDERPLMAVARVGDRIVSVGSRGLIVTSGDGGRTWIQSAVPVQSDLVALHFPNNDDGWAVGHDGVVLNSADGGKSWTKQLDGRIAYTVFVKYYGTADDAAENAVWISAAQEVERNLKSGPSLPFLDVWFEDRLRGFVVGSFGMIAATIDGGKTWQPWLHRIDNPDWLNLNSIRGIGNDIFIASEQGVVFKLDRKTEQFIRIDTGYTGSFFGLAGDKHNLIAYGLRGTVYRSSDGGTNWTQVSTPSTSTITGGTGPVGQARFLLVNDVGQLLVSDASGTTFRAVQPEEPMLLTAVEVLDSQNVILTGLGGVVIEPVKSEHN